MTDLIRQLTEQDRQRAEQAAMPEWLDPMLATLTHDAFADPDWIYERKLDGERVLTYISPQGKVCLYSRNRKELNDSYPDIEEALTGQAPHGCVLDGEVVAFASDGTSDFQKLQPRMQASSREDARQGQPRVFYYLFDCLYIDGHNVTACPLRARKRLLKEAITWQDPLRWTAYRNETGLEYYQQACTQGWEGLIAKHADAAYQHSRSRKWLKFKCVLQQEFILCGFTEPQGERIGFGALLLGFYRDGKLVYAGKVGTGFDDKTLSDLHSRLERLERKTSPFDEGDPPEDDVHFVTPKLVGEVTFTEWTADDRLRHPRFKGLRRDKAAVEVRKESGARTPE